MSTTSNKTRSTCVICGMKRYRAHMSIARPTPWRSKRFEWVCKPACEARFYNGKPTKATNNQLLNN